MSEIRLLLASLPTMLSGIIRHAVDAERDLRIVEELQTLEDLPEAAQRTRPNVVVVGTESGALPRECVQVMYTRPAAGALAISADGRVATAYRLGPQAMAVEKVSTTGLIEAIRELSRPIPELGE